GATAWTGGASVPQECQACEETTERVIAAQLRLACAGVEEPTPQFLHALAQTVERAVARDQRRQHPTGPSRGRFLGRAAQAAAAAGLVQRQQAIDARAFVERIAHVEPGK